MRDGTMAGAQFESLMALNLRVFAQAADAKVHHCRTKGGEHEIDFVIERQDRKVVAVEAKLKQTIETSDLRHIRWSEDRLGAEVLDSGVIATGRDAYRRRDGTAVVPAALFGS